MTLKGGPAAGSYMVKRAPLYLRAVVDPRAGRHGGCDVLDQVDDTPTARETVSVYRRVGEVGTMHLNRGGRGSGFTVLATYEHLPDIDGEQLRETAAWRSWVADAVPTEGAS